MTGAAAVLPDPVREPAPLGSTPEEAGRAGADLRAVAAELAEVQQWADRGAAPAGWSGDAAEAAAHARSRFARRVDVAREALQLAAVAATRFEDALVVLRRRRGELDGERRRLDADLAALHEDLRAGLPPEAAEPAAARLRGRASDLLTRIAGWEADVAHAEAAYVRGLRGLDSAGEAHRVATTVPLPATTALTRGMTALEGAPAAVAGWWRSLGVGQREALMIAVPTVVGGLAGIPVTGRDRANRAAIAVRRDELLLRRAEGPLSDEEAGELANLDAVQAAMDQHLGEVDPSSGRDLFKVVDFDARAYGGDGSAVVALGDPDAARYVATYTPGFTSDGGRLSDVERIGDLYPAMRGEDGGHRSVATVLYEDLDAPSLDEIKGPRDLLDPTRLGPALRDGLGVTTTADAQAGGRRLAGFLDALAVTRHRPDAEVSVIGHSYGSVVAAYAAHDHGAMDDVVLLANPGVPGHDVHDLVGDSGIRVYVGADDHDPVSLLGAGASGGPGTLGSDPAAESFGADRIRELSGPVTPSGVLAFGNHSSERYLGPGTPGLADVAALATGGTPHEVPGRTPHGYQDLTDLVAHAGLSAVPGPLDELVYDHGGGALLHGTLGVLRDAVGRTLGEVGQLR